jgi:hypothetical protein
MKWNNIILEMNSTEIEAQKQLRKEYQKLLKGFNSDLGKWLVDNESSIKEYMPEIYENAFDALVNAGSSVKNNKMYHEVAAYYKNLINSK